MGRVWISWIVQWCLLEVLQEGLLSLGIEICLLRESILIAFYLAKTGCNRENQIWSIFAVVGWLSFAWNSVDVPFSSFRYQPWFCTVVGCLLGFVVMCLAQFSSLWRCLQLVAVFFGIGSVLFCFCLILFPCFCSFLVAYALCTSMRFCLLDSFINVSSIGNFVVRTQ